MPEHQRPLLIFKDFVGEREERERRKTEREKEGERERKREREKEGERKMKREGKRRIYQLFSPLFCLSGLKLPTVKKIKELFSYFKKMPDWKNCIFPKEMKSILDFRVNFALIQVCL
jgi:hypothetical protein